jgi:catechol 2,3-dioxygenase-like lactoylglutathione lyase family enzyme
MVKTAFATIVVADMERSLRFYTSALGLKPGTRHDNFAFVQAPGVTIGLHPKPEHAGNTPRGNLSIGFEVDDMASAAERLAAQGVVLTQFENEEAKFALFSDPDGAPLYLIQTKETHHQLN